MTSPGRVLMIASENGALEGGKVGGIGDVVRDVPIALAELGHEVDVLTPAYQLFSKIPDAQKIVSFEIRFAGELAEVQLYKIPSRVQTCGVTHWALELPKKFYGHSNGIYFNDEAATPFATDATKFACFCMAAACVLINADLPEPDVIHLHDWHSALLLLLIKYDPVFSTLKTVPSVFTIHNLALQGIRPLNGHESALYSWFPALQCQLDQVIDPRATDCINPMRVGINLANKLHVVSPTYAEEIVLPSDPGKGFIGGEGLEQDLIAAKSNGKLFGILNGCVYPTKRSTRLTKKKLVQLIDVEILGLIAKRQELDSALYIAQKRLSDWANRKHSKLILTSIGRVTDQKVTLLRQQTASGLSALEDILFDLGDEGVFILLGNGDSELEVFLTVVASRHDNFIFIKGYCENLSDALYQSGDLFIMPSSFEPCGISQMLSMRAGQPCLVHAVGGLRDTVINDINGFCFEGKTVELQATNLVQRFTEVKKLMLTDTKRYSEISSQARKARFIWKHSAKQYITRLYEF